MNKASIIEQILTVLRHDLTALQSAVKVAHESATHEENVAENKYDTLGLEASYLAHGQAKRAAEIDAALQVYDAISPKILEQNCSEVGLCSFVKLEDQNERVRWIWMGAEAGGLKFFYDNKESTIVTPKSPLGAALMGRKVGDVFELRVGENVMEYEVVMLYYSTTMD